MYDTFFSDYIKLQFMLRDDLNEYFREKIEIGK